MAPATNNLHAGWTAAIYAAVAHLLYMLIAPGHTASGPEPLDEASLACAIAVFVIGITFCARAGMQPGWAARLLAVMALLVHLYWARMLVNHLPVGNRWPW
ncbi:hypothetical protein [Aeoliella mucimassa]|uniref:Uncharacterized protein n=1 Tax=Aeoliella mucimassa TaxID=2527972 RepID=A0A518AQ10_9BACT|nr:hypothetical protein [Aeoliella mucimassa]QDU56807.1 hypothetical protein Pan181_30190 [Aeoliella mucimassa]